LTRAWKGNPKLEPLLKRIEDLSLDPRNAREHPERNLATVKNLLSLVGQQTTIVIDSRSHVRAGNATMEAASELGWTHIAAITFDGDAVQALAYALLDNQSAELAEWDPTLLRANLERLAEENLDLLINAGFYPEEIPALLATYSDDQDEKPDTHSDSVTLTIRQVKPAHREPMLAKIQAALKGTGLECRSY
jgi:hypothetical protein